MQQWKDRELDDFIRSYCPNIEVPRKRHLKFLMAKEIKFLKGKFPISIPHPDTNGKLTISLDTFMQGEKI